MKKESSTQPLPLFQYGQEDLVARSQEPELFEREYFPFNHLYCGAETIREYAGLPEGRPVPWAMQAVMRYFDSPVQSNPSSDGLSPSSRKLLNSRMPFLFPIDEVRATELREFGVEGVHEIGSTFHYAREIYRRKGMESNVVERRGTIALPDKSDLGKLLDFDREAYAEKLAALPERFHPVYVSMHWRDYDRGCHEPYLEAGLPMVCAGHPHDPLFYERLYDTFRNFEFSCSNEISTSFGLSVLSGCRFFFFEGGNVTIKRAGGKYYEGREPTLERPEKIACREASPFPPDGDDGNRQNELASRCSGEHLVKPPEFFHEKWKEGRDMLSARAKVRDLVLDCEESYFEFSNWLPYGFDLDGWADAECGMEVPSRDGYDQIEIELEFLRLSRRRKVREIVMTFDGNPDTTVRTVIDSLVLTLVIPLRRDGERREIDFVGPEPLPVGDCGRERSFRLIAIRWKSGKPGLLSKISDYCKRIGKPVFDRMSGN